MCWGPNLSINSVGEVVASQTPFTHSAFSITAATLLTEVLVFPHWTTVSDTHNRVRAA